MFPTADRKHKRTHTDTTFFDLNLVSETLAICNDVPSNKAPITGRNEGHSLQCRKTRTSEKSALLVGSQLLRHRSKVHWLLNDCKESNDYPGNLSGIKSWNYNLKAGSRI
jgi:hypothetical protein